MGDTLHISDFGGGVALEGSADVQRIDELMSCDSYDLGERGQLVVASDLSAFATLKGVGGVVTAVRLYGVTGAGTSSKRYLLIVATGEDGFGGTQTILIRYDLPAGTQAALLVHAFNPQGMVPTFATFPFTDRLSRQLRATLVALAGREVDAPAAGGRTVMHYDTGAGYAAVSMTVADYLGTGSGQFNEVTAGTMAVNAIFRGVVAYNNHAFGWGYIGSDPNGDAPNRLAFSNVGNPTKWGNDPGPAGVDRVFADTDAINIGGSGEIIRCCCVWAGKLWIGTNKELHWLAGFGRESFLTNGSVSIRKSRNVVGPNAMIEGPDGLLYGCSTEGLWGYDGSAVEPLYRRLVDFRGKSLGWWDLIWRDDTRATAYPGQTNQDLVWLMADPDTMQVWVVIPHCDATAGYGFGNDTVVIKYHVQGGGFTRQVFAGQILTHGMLLRREMASPGRRFITMPAGLLKVYGDKATAAVSPILPTALPDVGFGEYAPFGPDGAGVTRKLYLTISWEAAASLPIVLTLTPTVDGEPLAAMTLSIQAAAPGAPANGDLWLDTSNTDTNIGNSVAGTITPAANDFIFKRWVTSWGKWVQVSAGGGMLGTRATLPIGYRGVPSTRLRIRVQTVSAAGRYQIEGLGLQPAVPR